MPPLLLDDDETVATLLGLATLADTGPAGDGSLNQAATQAYGKLDQFLPTRLRPRVTSLRASLETSSQHAPLINAEQLGAIAEAITGHEIVRFDYTSSQGDRTCRRVEPCRLVHHLLRWYLLAWDLHREDWRVFRLDRLNAPTRTGTRYTPRPLPAESALDYLRAGIHRTSQRITLTVEAPAPRVIDALKYQDAEIEPCGDQQTQVTLWLDSWQWLIPHLAALQTNFTLNAPPEFQRASNTFAQRLLAATGYCDDPQ